MTTTEVLTLSHALQAWRPDSLTLEFLAEPPLGEPFCAECADWHDPSEDHSNTTTPEDLAWTLKHVTVKRARR